MLRRLHRASIWAPDAIPASEEKYAAPLKRFVFPAFDLVVVVLGVFGLSTGFQAVRLTFPHPIPALLYGTLIVMGVVCFVACHFPRLWAPEIVGKFMIFVTLGVLFIAMLVAANEVPGHTGFVIAPLIVGMALFPMLRLWILGVELAKRRA